MAKKIHPQYSHFFNSHLFPQPFKIIRITRQPDLVPGHYSAFFTCPKINVIGPDVRRMSKSHVTHEFMTVFVNCNKISD